MTKETKNILKATLKQYERLVQYSDEEAQEVYAEVVKFFQNLINE